MQTKTCSKCKQQKSILDFYPKKMARDKHEHLCKECKKEYAKDYRQKNKRAVDLL